MTLKEEIAKLQWQIYIRNEYGIKEYKDEYEYEYGVHNWTKFTEQDKKGYLEESDEILKLFEKVIDAYIVDLKDGKEWGSSIPVITLEAVKEQLKK